MSHRDATVPEVRKRIENIDDDVYRHAFMYQFLIGGEPSEACGKYTPIGNDAIQIDFLVRDKRIPAVLFFIKTARRRGKLRTCAIPLNSNIEPWAEPLLEWFKKYGEQMPFEFGKRVKLSLKHNKAYLQKKAQKVFVGLEWQKEEYIDSEDGRKVERRYKPFTSSSLRVLRRQNLKEFYLFDEADLAIFGAWNEQVRDPSMRSDIEKILSTQYEKSNVDGIQKFAERYFVKLLRPISHLEQELLPTYLQVRDYHDLNVRFSRAQEISKLVRQCNSLGQGKLHAQYFKENMRIVIEMLNPCKNEEAQFITKIASLSALFTVELDPLRELVHDPEDRRSIRLVEKWLQDSEIKYDPTMIDTWKNINSLRNMEPIHETDPVELKRILDFFGILMVYPLDYSGLWDKILEKFQLSLKQWRQILNAL